MSDAILRRLRKARRLRQLAASTEFEGVTRRLIQRAERLEHEAGQLLYLDRGGWRVHIEARP